MVLSSYVIHNLLLNVSRDLELLLNLSRGIEGEIKLGRKSHRSFVTPERECMRLVLLIFKPTHLTCKALLLHFNTTKR